MKKTIKDLWHELSIPEAFDKERYACSAFNNSNLIVLKTKKNQFGILLSDIYERHKKKYDNIDFTDHKKISIQNKTFESCCIIVQKETLNSELFANTFDEHFISLIGIKEMYTLENIYTVLDAIEEITISNEKGLKNVIGLWGELYVLNELIQKKEEDILKYINSWESSSNRTTHDFNIDVELIKIEVKTTLKNSRSHTLNSLEQISVPDPQWKGYLASICLVENLNGKSCLDLKNQIISSFGDKKKYLDAFENKIHLRGKDLFDDSTRFSISDEHPFKYFNFEFVPKPTQPDGVIKIEFEITLENINSEALDF